MFTARKNNFLIKNFQKATQLINNVQIVLPKVNHYYRFAIET